jgi:hypothetical protein
VTEVGSTEQRVAYATSGGPVTVFFEWEEGAWVMTTLRLP